MYQIAVCDDEVLDREKIAGLTCGILRQEGTSCRITSFAHGAELLSAIQSGARFQILLLDVMMDGLDGMELAATRRGGLRIVDPEGLRAISESTE